MYVMNLLLILAFFISSFGSLHCWIVNPGPKVIATKGEVWPKPQTQKRYDSFYTIGETSFDFNVVSENCAILRKVIRRYKHIIFRTNSVVRQTKFNSSPPQNNAKYLGPLKILDVQLLKACSDDEYPSLNMDEKYYLEISDDVQENSVLSASSIWGVLRGLETFSQLIYLSKDETTLIINATQINDFPRFSHRGLLLDTSRHFLPVDVILKNLDAMSYNKFNVLHWHIVDDQSFPYQSPMFPELSERGAYHPVKKIYTPDSVKKIIEYARLRGIRVIPEFDTPGHTRSWGEGIPELLTACYKDGIATRQLGPMDPSRPFTFSFLDTFFEEIKQTFPDEYVHLGGDEVPFDCWESNADVNNFMTSLNITGDYAALESYFTEKLLDIVSKKDLTSIVWEEVFLSGTKMQSDTTVQVWLGGYESLRNVVSENCAILRKVIRRYKHIIFRTNSVVRQTKFNSSPPQNNAKYLGPLKILDVQLLKACSDDEYPSLNMDEKYYLEISDDVQENSVLSASSIWGVLRGLETFSQLIYLTEDETTLIINATQINDFPRFSHRGLLLDTSRHFLPVDVILKNLDAMSYNKFNVLHWHIVDDQSFPYQSPMFPELSERGAYHPVKKIYTPDSVKKVIEYARLRGIRVIPEFDTPGHTRSWGEGIPELLTACYKDGIATRQLGPMDPSRPFTFSFLDTFFEEIKQTFPDEYVHLGGDEVPFDCWESNADVNNFMTSLNITGDYAALESYFTEKLLDIVSKKDLTSIVWEEVFLSGTKMQSDTTVQVWLGGYESLRNVTASGKRALLSSCWYLDRLNNGGDWSKFYDCDPQDFGGSEEELKLILGGEACMWGEVVDRHNVLPRVWPRASAIAEKLWSSHKADTVDKAQRRLEEHACRMSMRNIPAQPPNGPGFCLD